MAASERSDARRPRRWLWRWGVGLAALTLLAIGLLWHLNYNDGVDITAAEPAPADAATLARGTYLARVGNCLACHTARGGVPAAGGRPASTKAIISRPPRCVHRRTKRASARKRYSAPSPAS